MEKHVSRLYRTCICHLYSPVMNGLGAEPAARRGEDVKDKENGLPIWVGQRPRDFHIKVVHLTFVLKLRFLRVD